MTVMAESEKRDRLNCRCEHRRPAGDPGDFAGYPEDKARGVECGADAYIVKSRFDQTNLLETIQQSCIVYGMPKEAITRNAVDIALSLEQITFTLMRLAEAVNGAHVEGQAR
jgi:hypothetical protein